MSTIYTHLGKITVCADIPSTRRISGQTRCSALVLNAKSNLHDINDGMADMTGIIIRRPKMQERAQIHALFDVVIRHTFELEGVGEEFELIGKLIADQQNLIDLDIDTDGQQCFFLIAQHKGQVVGTICVRPCSDIIRECADRDTSGMLEIGSVYVLPELQGKGIAKLLLNRIYQTLRAKGIDEFWLDSGYDIAKQVWLNILGKPSIIMKDYWAEGVDHHLWFRKLDDVDVEDKV